jgi:hypothetical protein
VFLPARQVSQHGEKRKAKTPCWLLFFSFRNWIYREVSP